MGIEEIDQERSDTITQLLINWGYEPHEFMKAEDTVQCDIIGSVVYLNQKGEYKQKVLDEEKIRKLFNLELTGETPKGRKTAWG